MKPAYVYFDLNRDAPGILTMRKQAVVAATADACKNMRVGTSNNKVPDA